MSASVTASLGKYADAATAGVTVFLIVAAVLAHVFAGYLPKEDTTFLDLGAVLALGALFGRTSAANGYAKMALAAHQRLDAINAPPAGDGTAAQAAPPPNYGIGA